MTDLRGQNSGNQEKKSVKWIILFAVAVVLIVIAVIFFVKGRMGENSDATMNRTAAKTEENEIEDPAQPAPGSADTTEAVEVQSTEQTVDMSGDYIGDIASPLPPPSSSYR